MIPKFFFSGGRTTAPNEIKQHEENLNKVFEKGPI